MEVTFRNVTVTVQAETAADAYTALCNALGTLDGDFKTDTYERENIDTRSRDTAELFPANADGTEARVVPCYGATPEVMIRVEGGIVQSVFADRRVNVSVIDYDTDDACDDDELCNIPQDDGTTSEARIDSYSADVMPEEIARINSIIANDGAINIGVSTHEGAAR